ncbi:agmatine deiminase family protein [Pelagibaculum spongiae]|uniref:agmatine deiminase family protein n=1 Tax=Pelagibaculum spongiae TaxID=2080658 RepID=UPI0013148BD2|nr:agmatine deiminase family protein [Pelagibaculum spongiae]
MQHQSSKRLHNEWHDQIATLLCWPHQQSDWFEQIDRVAPEFAAFAATITRFQKLLLICHDEATWQQAQPWLKKAGADFSQIQPLLIATNDTWCRDFAPLTLQVDGKPQLLNLVFNGWGQKYDHALDAAAAADPVMVEALTELYSNHPQPQWNHQALVFEGGGLESNGAGVLLTTDACVMHPKRNPDLSRQQILKKLSELTGASEVYSLSEGGLSGDDTDSHIDNLARFVSKNCIVYLQCDQTDDENYSALNKMQRELLTLQRPNNQPDFDLIAMPQPDPIFDCDNRRVPASYINFVLVNGAVLVPQYGVAQDATALQILGDCFPDRQAIGLSCRALIEQNGSLHCLSMQLPKI